MKILKHEVFPGLQVNHIIDVNFRGFEDLVDAIGCVYTDVDHRYYNNTAVTDYSSIDIQPGYQKLCGDNQAETGALAFVRFRHTDTDIVRNARQQDFLRWAKSQFNASTQICPSRDKLLKIFGANSQTDANLHSTDGLINLFNLIAFSAGPHGQADPFPASCRAPHDQQLQLRRSPTPGAEHAAFHAVHDADPGASAAPSTAGAAPPHKPARGGAAGGLSDLFVDVTGGGPGHGSAAIGIPIYYPRLIVDRREYCPLDTETAAGHGNREQPAPRRLPQGISDPRSRASATTLLRMTIEINSVLR